MRKKTKTISRQSCVCRCTWGWYNQRNAARLHAEFRTNMMTQRCVHLSENRLKEAAKASGAAWEDHEAKERGKEEAGQVVNFEK